MHKAVDNNKYVRDRVQENSEIQVDMTKTACEVERVQGKDECLNTDHADRKFRFSTAALSAIVEAETPSCVGDSSPSSIVPSHPQGTAGGFAFYLEPCSHRHSRYGEPLGEGMAQGEHSPTCLKNRANSSCYQSAGCNIGPRKQSSVGLKTIARGCSKCEVTDRPSKVCQRKPLLRIKAKGWFVLALSLPSMVAKSTVLGLFKTV